jgi:hypothetical protein
MIDQTSPIVRLEKLTNSLCDDLFNHCLVLRCASGKLLLPYLLISSIYWSPGSRGKLWETLKTSPPPIWPIAPNCIDLAPAAPNML